VRGKATDTKANLRKPKSELKAMEIATKLLIQLHGPALKELEKY